MITYLLQDTNSSLVAKLTGAPATTEPTFDAPILTVETATGANVKGSSAGTFNSTTEITLVAAPASGHTIAVGALKIGNLDTASITVLLGVRTGVSAVTYQPFVITAGQTLIIGASSGSTGGSSAGVTSFNTRTGPVNPAASDYAASQVSNDSTVTGSFVKDALNTLLAAINGISLTWASITGKPTAFTPTAHASTHATGGSDALALSDIGAQAALGYTPENVANKNANSGYPGLDANGRLGIGTTSPVSLVDVRGTTAAGMLTSDCGINLIFVADAAAPTLALVASAGNVNAGTHYYIVTYVTAIGETRGTLSAVITTDAGHGQVTVTLPVSTDPRVTSRKVYRSKAGDSYYAQCLVATVADNTTGTYTDNIADASLDTTKNAYYRDNTTNNALTRNGVRVMMPGAQNTIFGLSAGASLTTGGGNALLGASAGTVLTSGTDNTFLGHFSGMSYTTGWSNTALGSNALYYGTTGGNNVGVGYLAGLNNQTGNRNVLIGVSAGAGTTIHNKSDCVMIGYQAGKNENGNSKLYIHNTSSATPLIYGDFTGGLTINAQSSTLAALNLQLVSGHSGYAFTILPFGSATPVFEVDAAGVVWPTGYKSSDGTTGATVTAGWSVFKNGLFTSTTAAKGDLLVGASATTVQRLTVGSDGQVPIADAAQSTGIRWGNISGGPTTSTNDTTYVISVDGNDSNTGTCTALTGTLSCTATSQNVSGINTLFTTEVNVGDYIVIGKEPRKVLSIGSNTAMVVTSQFLVSTSAVTGYKCTATLLTHAGVIAKLPAVINHTYLVLDCVSSISETVAISNLAGYGSISFYGSATSSAAATVVGFSVTNCTLNDIQIRGYQLSGTSTNNIYITGGNVLIAFCSMTANYSGTGMGIYAYSPYEGIASSVRAVGNTISNRYVAIRSEQRSCVYTYSNSGSGNTTGLWAINGGYITKGDNGQPGGTTAEGNTGGGVLVGSSGVKIGTS